MFNCSVAKERKDAVDSLVLSSKEAHSRGRAQTSVLLHEASAPITCWRQITFTPRNSYLRLAFCAIVLHQSSLTSPTQPNSLHSTPLTTMSVRTVGIARAPAGLSPAEFNARVQGVADTLLALPIASSAITKHELVRRLFPASSMLNP
jgi:hypothetical protein